MNSTTHAHYLDEFSADKKLESVSSRYCGLSGWEMGLALEMREKRWKQQASHFFLALPHLSLSLSLMGRSWVGQN